MYRCHIWRILTPSVPCPGSGACSCSTSRAWWPGAAAPRWTDSPPWRTSRTTPPPSSGCAGQHYITPFLALLIYGFNFSNILWFDRNPGWQVTINLHWSMMMAFYEKYFLTRLLHVLLAMPPAAFPDTCLVAASPAQFTATATGRVSTPRLTPSMVWRNEWLYHTRIRQHGRTNPIITEYLHTVYLFTM